MKQITITKSITNREDESFNLYLKDVAKIPLITPEEEAGLWKRVIEDNDLQAKHRLIEGNIRFVITCAKHFQGQGLSLGDLVAEGNIGLIKAVDKYNPNKGVKFISYAVNWIEQSIIDALSCTSRTIRLPISHLNEKRKIYNASLKLEQQLEREASLAELSAETGLEEEKVSKTLGTSTNCVSLDLPFENTHDDTTCLLDIIPNDDLGIENNIENRDEKECINQALESLSPRSRCIIRLFFGIDVNSITLEEIGELFGLTSERVRQLKDEALEDMKKYMIKYNM